MKKYEVTRLIKVSAGAEIGLNKDQAASREHMIEKKGRHFVAIQPLQFKVGEVIQLVDVPKGQDAYLVPVGVGSEKDDSQGVESGSDDIASGVPGAVN